MACAGAEPRQGLEVLCGEEDGDLLRSDFAPRTSQPYHTQGQTALERTARPPRWLSPLFPSGRMPEYIYLLETRLSAAQKNALKQVREAAREAGMTVFLAGGAVRDLTTGSSVRDLDFAIQGNALNLQAALEARGGTMWGRHEASRTLFFWFPGSVRIEVSSTRSEKFPKPGEPVYSWSSIVDDLHRRDFTANAMALSLNEGSYGLLLDPLNGVADIEARHLRLVSNYGFIEDPSRLVRAARLRHRLGWTFEGRTATRYDNAKEADNFDVISAYLRGYELEKIAAEDEALQTLKTLEAEGWMAKLMPAWTSASVDTAALEDLHRNRIQLLMQHVAPDLSAVHLEVLTAKMDAADRAELKKAMVRPGLLAQWEGLDTAAKEFAKLLTSKEANAPSATWKLFHEHPAEAILWLAHTRKGAAVEAKFKNFFSVWPEAAKKVPVALMLEMRITPDLPNYQELLHAMFLEQIDGKLETDEQIRAFLEKYSPPAPPPPVTLRRSRSKKSDGRSKRKEAARDEDDEDDDDRPAARGGDDDDEDADDAIAASDDDAGEDDSLDEDGEEEEQPVAELGAARKQGLGKVSFDKVDLDAVLGRIQQDEDSEDSDDSDDEDDDEEEKAPPARAQVAPAKKAAAKQPARAAASASPAKGTAKAAAGDEETAPPVPATSETVPAEKPTESVAASAAKPKPAAAKAIGYKAVPEKSTTAGGHASVSFAAVPAEKVVPGKAPAKAAASPAKAAAPAKKSSEPSRPAGLDKPEAAPAKAAPVPAKAAPADAKKSAVVAPAKAPAKSAAKAVGKSTGSRPEPAKKQ